MITYSSSYIYLQSATTLEAKIAKIDAIIEALEDTALRAAAGEDVSEYHLDDGQSRIRTTYRSTQDVFNSINAFEKLRAMYQNRLNGIVVRLVDSKSVKRNF